jgi:hypothetical protein
MKIAASSQESLMITCSGVVEQRAAALQRLRRGTFGVL